MDNLTHTLTGLALSRAGLNRLYARPALVLLTAANMPDIDVVSLAGGAAGYLEYHRGLTHSLAGMPVIAILPVLLAIAVRRSAAGWKAAYLLSLAGVASHLLLDWTNTYAVRLLLPFSGTWLHGDLNNVVDPWILAVLLLAALGPLLGRLVSAEMGAQPGSGRGLAVFALAFILVYDFGRYLLHERAVETLNARIYDGAAPERVAAFPLALNPLHWVGWVDTSHSSIRFDVNLASGFDPSAGTKFYKPDPSPAIAAVKNTHAFQVMGNFAIYPLWTVSPTDEPEGGVRVDLRDQRFPFQATAIVDKAGRVLRSSLHF